MKEREELLRQIISRAKDACNKKKWLRVKRSFLVLSGVIYLIAFAWGEMNEIKEFLGWLVGAPILSGLVILGSVIVLLHIIKGGMEDAKYIASLEGELNATIRFNSRKNKDEL